VCTARSSVVLALLAVLCTGAAATGHKPVSIGGSYPTFDEALRITDIDVSQVAYVELSETERALWLAFEATAGTHLDVSLGLPVLDRLADSRPTLAVLGPGLPAIVLPFETPQGVGGVAFETSAVAKPRFFHEPFTGTDSWIPLEESLDLPETGTYYVVAWPPGEPIDKLWVAIGVRERFGLRDILAMPRIVRDVRAFHEVPVRPGGGIVGKLLFLGLAAALIGALVAWART